MDRDALIGYEELHSRLLCKSGADLVKNKLVFICEDLKHHSSVSHLLSSADLFTTVALISMLLWDSFVSWSLLKVNKFISWYLTLIGYLHNCKHRSDSTDWLFPLQSCSISPTCTICFSKKNTFLFLILLPGSPSLPWDPAWCSSGSASSEAPPASW